MAYYDKKTLATEDAMRIGRLHTFLPGDQFYSAQCFFLELAYKYCIYLCLQALAA